MTSFPRITRNSAIMGGKAFISGMRVTVGMIVGQIADGANIDELLGESPYLSNGKTSLEREDIVDAPRYAAWLASEREIDLAIGRSP
jgi:uncharacterized protein (DUF433 family)